MLKNICLQFKFYIIFNQFCVWILWCRILFRYISLNYFRHSDKTASSETKFKLNMFFCWKFMKLVFKQGFLWWEIIKLQRWVKVKNTFWFRILSVCVCFSIKSLKWVMVDSNDFVWDSEDLTFLFAESTFCSRVLNKIKNAYLKQCKISHQIYVRLK